MKGLRIDYTIYSPDYSGDPKLRTGECWDFHTIRGARKKAKELGVGSLVVRNFNREHTEGVVDIWWQSPYCWVWNGFAFKKVYPLGEKKWKIDPSAWNRASLERQLHPERR